MDIVAILFFGFSKSNQTQRGLFGAHKLCRHSALYISAHRQNSKRRVRKEKTTLVTDRRREQQEEEDEEEREREREKKEYKDLGLE